MMLPPRLASAVLFSSVLWAAALGACSDPAGTEPEATRAANEVDAAPGDDAALGVDGSVSPVDPFAPQPDESEGLVNVSSNLAALLEHGALKDACDRYFKGATDRKTKLLCGKWMFFYESFDTVGVPTAIMSFLSKNFPDELGLGFSKIGMVEDPSSPDHLPLGLGKTKAGKSESLAYTCASCHFAQLPDGRYAVGAPNHRYEYGKQVLAIALAPSLGMGLGNEADHDPQAVARVRPIVDKLKNDFALKAKFGLALLPLAGGERPSLSKDIERAYADWPVGTMDFLMAPLPVDDTVHIVSKIIALWGIPREAEIKASGMEHAMLAWNGNAQGLHPFLDGFALFGGAPFPPKEKLEPLMEYVYSLRAPENPKPPPKDEVARGAALFVSKGCADCHGGPRGSGKRIYTFDEIGTDRALARWVDPTLSGKPCCNIDLSTTVLSQGVKSPRLNGMWALGRFLHNGSLGSLDELFCLTPRPPSRPEPLGNQGHDFTCNGLSDAEKRSLQSYLLAH